MRAKAKYYVGDWLGQWERVIGKKQAFAVAAMWLALYPDPCIRIRYRGRIIAKWVNGKRVNLEKRRTR